MHTSVCQTLNPSLQGAKAFFSGFQAATCRMFQGYEFTLDCAAQHGSCCLFCHCLAMHSHTHIHALFSGHQAILRTAGLFLVYSPAGSQSSLARSNLFFTLVCFRRVGILCASTLECLLPCCCGALRTAKWPTYLSVEPWRSIVATMHNATRNSSQPKP